MSRKSGITALIIIIIIIIACVFIYRQKKNNSAAKPELSWINPRRDDLRIIVTAAGTVEPVDKVQVGTQVSGVVKRVYAGFNSNVKKGQLLAELDKTLLQARFDQAESAVRSAQALKELKFKSLKRTRELFNTGSVSSQDLDLAEYQSEEAAAALIKAKAELDMARANLNYAEIRSPVDGIVLNRTVEEGQTVAASFNTPTLFTLAKDLAKIQIEASADEADMGVLQPGQSVSFTVDAFPDSVFAGIVKQVRLNPEVNSSVVTYRVIIEADNINRRLIPGMTANTEITVRHIVHTMLIPLKTLQLAEDSAIYRYCYGDNKKSFKPGHAGAVKSGEGKYDALNSREQKVWVKRDGRCFLLPVKTGEENEEWAEVLSGLSEKDSLIAEVKKNSIDKKGARSPFMPARPQRSGR